MFPFLQVGELPQVVVVGRFDDMVSRLLSVCEDEFLDIFLYSIVDGFEIEKSVFLVVVSGLVTSCHELGNFWEEAVLLRDVALQAIRSP